MESIYTRRNLLWYALRGAIKSIPFAGAFLHELLIGPVDRAKSQEVLQRLRGQSDSLEEAVRYVREQAQLSRENAGKLDDLLSLISAVRKEKEQTHPFLDDVTQAFQAIVEHAPLNAYVADLALDLGQWRGLGLDRPVDIRNVYVSTSLSSGQFNKRSSISQEEVLQGLLNEQSRKRNLLIEGPAGSGKSTLLRYWALDLADRASWGSGFSKDSGASECAYVPIFLPLNFVEMSCSAVNNWSLPLSDLVARRFLPLDDRLSQQVHISIVRAIQSRHVLILLDGADEISEQRHPDIKSWIEAVSHTGNPVVLTSRPRIDFVDGLQNFHRYSVCPFSRDDRECFILRWFQSIHQPERADGISKYLGRQDMFRMSAEEVTGNPLFLTMMCIEFELTGKLSRTPAQLIEQFTKILLDEWNLQKGLPRSQFSLDLKRRVLELCASQFFEDNRTKFFLEELVSCTQSVLAKSGYSFEPQELIREIESRSGLLL
jgi:hypothetical protein